MIRSAVRPGNIRAALLVLTGLLALAAGLSAQHFLVRTYEEQDGLINSAVNDIAQDDLGRMWFSVRNGISVYDGAKWTAFNTANGLPTTAVRQLRADGRGGLWAIGENPSAQLLHFVRESWQAFPIPFPAERAVQITGLAVRAEPEGIRAAVGTRDAGVLLFSGTRWTAVTEAQGLPGKTIYGIEADDDGFLVATEKGLFFLGRDGVEIRWGNSAPLLRGSIRGLAVEKTAAGKIIWVAGESWLGRINGGTFNLLTEKSPVLFNDVYPQAVLLPDGQGGLFLGNALGVAFFNKTDGLAYPVGTREGLVAEGATSLFLDREGNLWVGGLRGVSRISSRRFYNYRTAQGLLEDEVTAIHLIGEDDIAFGHNSGLTVLIGDRFEKIPFSRKPGALPNDTRVADMADDGAGGLWFAASMLGLGHWTKAGGLGWTALPGAVTSVVVDQNRTVWIAASNGLFQMKGGRPVQVFQDVLSNTYIRKLDLASDGSIFASTTTRGIYRWDGKTWTRFTSETERGAASIFAVHVDAQGRTLVGTFSGLYEISDGRLVRFSERGFEIQRPVYLILEDKPGRLWFGTDNGVIRWDGTTRRMFSKAEGLAGREVNRAAGMIDRLGRAWIGTNSGVSCYLEKYDRDPEAIPPPLLSITGLEVNGSAHEISEDITLGYRENNLVFRFLGTSFLDENGLRFQSRLDGFDQTWSGENAEMDREIRYTNLAPGAYVFNLRARNALGGLSEIVSTPVIRIRNPFWFQWWFILAALLAGGGIVLSVGLAVTQHRQAERLEALVVDRTAQIQATLNEKEILLKEVHHRVKNNLQIISSLLFLQSRKITDPTALGLFQGSISRIRAMALVHESLYRSDRLTSIGMEDYLRQLVNHLTETYALRKDSVRIEVRAPGISLPLETAITYGLIINELISNALKHAFPGDRSGRIQVLLARAGSENSAGGETAGKIVLTVQDDGIGIPPEMEGGRSDSLGLRLVQNLVSQLDGTIEVRRYGGTVFRIVFPG